MTLRSTILIAVAILFGAVALAADDQNDNVLDKAREKYKSAETSPNAAEAVINPPVLAQDSPPPTPAATPAPQLVAPAPTASPAPLAQASAAPNVQAGVSPTVEIVVVPPTIGVVVEIEKPRPVRAFSFQPFPGVPRRGATADVGVGIGLTVNKVNSIHAMQMSLLGNLAKESVTGYQGSLFFNQAGSVEGVQATGVVNIAGDVEGVQVSGLINVARKVKGVQIGLVNISDEMDGMAIGLINYSKKGINEIPVWYGDNDFLYTGLQMGGRNAYILLYGGEVTGDWFRYINTMTVGASLGLRGKCGPFYIQGDLGIKSAVVPTGTFWTWNYQDGNGSSQIGSLEKPGFNAFGNFRVTAGFTIWGPFSVFAGLNADIDGGKYWHMPEQYKTSWNFLLPGKELSANLSWIFGISL